jgi:hypothetical protein
MQVANTRLKRFCTEMPESSGHITCSKATHIEHMATQMCAGRQCSNDPKVKKDFVSVR